MEIPVPLNNTTNCCINCCAILPHFCNDNNFERYLLSKPSSPPSSDPKTALTSIFRLNFLKAFDTLQWEEESQQIPLLCVSCNNVLTNLYLLYEEFLQLCRIDSVLGKTLARLDEIVDFHQQRNISCDLIKVSREKENKILVSERSSQPSSSSSYSCLQSSSKEPTVLLTRLSSDHMNELTTNRTILKKEISSDEDEDVSSDQNDDNDDDYLPPQQNLNIEAKDDSQSAAFSESDDDHEIPLQPKTRSLKGRKTTATKTSSKRKQDPGSSPKKVKSSRTKSKQRQPNPQKNKGDNKTKTILKPKTRSNYIGMRAKFANPCWYCDRTDFSNPIECLKHTAIEHLPKINCTLSPTSTKICERCSKICKSDELYTIHLKWCELIPSGETVSTEYKCQICSKIFSNSTYLSNHERRTHRKPRTKEFLCEFCSKTFLEKANLQSHLLLHKDDKPFACDQCDYRATRMYYVRRHQKFQHNEIEKVKCDVCNSLHKNQHAMKIHRRVMHTAEGYKKYREQQEANLKRLREKHKANPVSTFCVDCNVDFFHRLGLIHHRRAVHADNMGREFICESCGKDFVSRRSLDDHTENVHSDARPFICDTCGKSFKRERTLLNHLKQSHTEEGRLMYNQKTREWSQRRKIVANQLAGK